MPNQQSQSQLKKQQHVDDLTCERTKLNIEHKKQPKQKSKTQQQQTQHPKPMANNNPKQQQHGETTHKEKQQHIETNMQHKQKFELQQNTQQK